MELRNAILGQSNHKKEESYVTKIDIGAVYEKKVTYLIYSAVKRVG